MTWKPWLLALVLLCACRASAPLPAASPAETPLPDVFGPIGWNTTADSLRARFPEAQVTETEPRATGWMDEDGSELMAVEVLATDAHLEPFGTVDIRVMRFEGHPLAVLSPKQVRRGRAWHQRQRSARGRRRRGRREWTRRN